MKLTVAEWLERLIVTKDDPLTGIYDAAVAVSCGLSRDGKGVSPQSEATVWDASRLMLGGTARNLILTGEYSYRGGPAEALAMERFLRGQTPQNLLDRRLWMVPGYRTYHIADEILALARRNGWRRILIVAQQQHMGIKGVGGAKTTFLARFRGSGIEVSAQKAWTPYTRNNSQWRLRSMWLFLLWNILTRTYGRLRGYN